MEKQSPVILALYPNSSGLGYACIQVPERLMDYGVTTTTPLSNGKLLRRTERFMKYYQPKVIVLRESFSKDGKGRSDRLIAAITTLAGEMGIEVHRYSKQQIRDTFEVFGAETRHEIASKIVQFLPELAHRAPKVRKWYEKEDYNMPVFDALALAITHAHLNE